MHGAYNSLSLINSLYQEKCRPNQGRPSCYARLSRRSTNACVRTMDYSKLLVKKLPSLLTGEEKQGLLKCFGANQVDIFPPSGRMRACAIAHFSCKEEATQAMMKLHQLKILGSHLVVEYVHDRRLRARDANDGRWKCKTLPISESTGDQGSLLEHAPDSANEDKTKDEESSESELSLSDDDDQLKPKPYLPQKRPVISTQSHISSKSKVIKPISIELMWKRDHVDTDSADKVRVENETQSVLSEEEKVLEEIRSCRLTSEEQQEFTVFRNYNPGKSSSKLYIKNLSRSVQQQDLERLFGVFATDKSSFSVKLMKTGRMKDQAFVSYSSENEALKALEETNSFKFNEKPMVVLFSNAAS